MFRNLGGAIGTAVLATVITKREQFHSNIIGQSVTIYRDNYGAPHICGWTGASCVFGCG